MEVKIMADRRKRSNGNTKSNESQAPAETPNTEESAVTTVTAEAENTEATESTPATEADNKAEAEKSAEPDLTAFRASVEAAAAEADASTGVVPEAEIAKVTEQYRALEGIKAKNAAKALVNEYMKQGMADGDLGKARAYLMLSEKALVAASAGGGARAERAPADPTENVVQRIATLELARENVVVPEEGVAEDYLDRVSKLVSENGDAVKSYLTWMQAEGDDKGDEPDVSAVVRNAAKLALGKSAKAGPARGRASVYTGERRDIAKHIREVFADLDEGTFLPIAEIRGKHSEEYGDNPPSAGAISARLFPKPPAKSTMLKYGIRPDTQDGKKGAVKDSSVAEGDES